MTDIQPASDEQIAAYERGEEPWDSWADGIDALIARIRQAEAALSEVRRSAQSGVHLYPYNEWDRGCISEAQATLRILDRHGYGGSDQDSKE